jgi:hypothetical protein
MPVMSLLFFQLVEDGRFLNESYSLDHFLRINGIEHRWKGMAVPEDFMKCVFIAAVHQLLMMRRARLLCDAFTAGHVGVLQAWEDHVSTPDVVKLLDRLRTIVVAEFAVYEAAAAEALAVAREARKAARMARRKAGQPEWDDSTEVQLSISLYRASGELVCAQLDGFLYV